MAIYSENAPQDTPALMKYGSVIRELASQGANWKFYDENLRSIRQHPGTRFMLSYGLGLIIFEPNPVPTQEKGNKMASLSQKGFAGNFIGDSLAQGALTSTNVSGVGTATQFLNLNRPPNHPLGMQDPNQLLLPTGALTTAVLPSEALSTPVKAESLAAYLTGYPENLRKNLLSGFSHGFRLHYNGPLESSQSTNLVSAAEHSAMVDQK